MNLHEELAEKDSLIAAQSARIAELEAQIAAASAPADTDKLREAIPEGWAFDMTSSGHMTVQKKGLGGYLASPDSSNIASSLLFELANDLLAASTALQARVREVPGWLPIETAPKSCMDRFVVIAFDVELNHGKYTSDPYCTWPEKDGSFARWPHTFKPTHWMPLPAAPVQEPKP